MGTRLAAALLLLAVDAAPCTVPFISMEAPMGYVVGLEPGTAGPADKEVGTAQEALTYLNAMKRGFGAVVVRDSQGNKVSEAELNRRANEERDQQRQEFFRRQR